MAATTAAAVTAASGARSRNRVTSQAPSSEMARQAGPATLAAEIFAAWQGTDYIRTHDVAAARDALTLLAAITSEARNA